MNYTNLSNLTIGDIPPGTVYLGSSANANNLSAYCSLGQGANYPDNGFWYILQTEYNATNKKQFAMSYKGYGTKVRQMIDGAWSDWLGVITKADIQSGSISFATTSGTQTAKNVVFPEVFGAAPKVFVNIKAASSKNKFVNAGNVTSTGFTIYANVDTDNITVDWTAFSI